ncbi:MAG: PDZ domain-containing protein [Gemmatimonadales bacterium]|nr:PDZ domain-containing protein [Gemmatimonadales bacterium]NIN11234.1 PDZ domain-containing protein [Gemmatimonadales bacterium]NIN49833.1 PDZ domain-containing protein [Gemmatimonadales bacterium]NIP07297.1 PDZ domain-containing protein [Gemmatimonadales bacterium]NIR02992.1 PDZ domain-containing protein [Gemmatimonadales bacterium]
MPSNRDLVAAATVAFLLVGTLPGRAVAQRQPYEHMQTLTRTIAQVRTNYVDTVDYGFLVRAAIDGMLRALDPYSRYMTAEEWAAWWARQRGEYAGVGVVLESADGAIIVLSVLPQSPAERSGIVPGDRLVAVDDTSTAGRDPMDVERWLTGAEGSKATLVLERGARLQPDTVSVAVRRRRLDVPGVWRADLADSTTGYAWLAQLAPNSAEQVQDAVRRLMRVGAERLILDLRGNPGGSVGALTEVASLFLPESTVVLRTVGRTRDAVTSEVTRGAPVFPDLPLIVLIDGYSASAAEVLTGALQDHDRALVMGRQSFGKGLVQTPFPLASGDVVWLTTARITTPSGRPFHRGTARDTAGTPVYHTDNERPVRAGPGIVPDIELPAPSTLPAWWTAAMSLGLAESVADSVANALPKDSATRARWLAHQSAWSEALLDTFVERVRRELDIPELQLEPAHVRPLVQWLAVRVAQVRWGADAASELFLTHDDYVQAALREFPRLGELLATEGS